VLAITARPRSIASRATIPKPSPKDGTTTISARSKTGAAGATLPRKATDPRRSRRSTLASSEARSGPSPAISSVSSGTEARAAATASSKTS